MKILKFLPALAMLMVCYFVSAQKAAENKSDQYQALAKKLVTECASVKEGEIVLISGSVKDNELLEDIAVNVRKQGAFPLLTFGSDRLTRLMYTDVPEKYDSQTSQLDMKLYEMVNTVINLNINENPGLLSDIPPERFITINKASEPVNELILKKSIKIVAVGNGLYPTEANAKSLGITLAELNDLFWNGLNVDYQKMHATANNLKSMLAAGKELHITNANGTDLKVQIQNKNIICSDGIIQSENLDKGTIFSIVYLPAGEVMLCPEPGTAEGKVIVDKVFYQDKVIEGMALTFSKGMLVSMEAKSGLEVFKALYDAAPAGKEEFSTLDFGINPNAANKLPNWIPAGMVTVGIGNNAGLGGSNKTPFGYNFFIPGSTVELDGKVLVDKGTLKM